MLPVGTLATGAIASVDPQGVVECGPTRLAWRVQTNAGWITPGADGVVRQTRPDAAPVVHTALRIPGGDAIERVYAVEDGGGVVVVEVENASPEAIAVAFAPTGSGTELSFARAPGAREEGAVVFPVPHRTTVRVALGAGPLDVRALPDAAAVVRAWDRLLDRGLRTELPDPLQHDVDAARADLLLAPPSADAFGALEAWGFDTEAVAMWSRLGMRARRAARRSRGTGLLAHTRAALVRETNDAVEILPGFRAEWLGQHLAAHEIPLRKGRCSFAVRWHAERPALLWDVPPGTTVRVPALDLSFSATASKGDTLLAEPPKSLLPMGERAPVVGGARINPPSEFS